MKILKVYDCYITENNYSVCEVIDLINNYV